LHDGATAAFARHSGRPIGIGPETLSARFDGPARAVRCALALIETAATLGLEVAAGVHTGEIEIHEQMAAGLAIHVAERVCARARAGEVLASGVVADLVAGSGLHFAERGSEAVEGLESELRVFAASDGQPAAAPPRHAAGLDTLSAREREVVHFLADGLSNAAIAKRLSLSEHTVKRHVANILVKLGLPTRAAAAALAARQRTG
jgi:DNA-binding CsgD family transcriptional regulator